VNLSLLRVEANFIVAIAAREGHIAEHKGRYVVVFSAGTHMHLLHRWRAKPALASSSASVIAQILAELFAVGLFP
jgi:hypothetical protein